MPYSCPNKFTKPPLPLRQVVQVGWQSLFMKKSNLYIPTFTHANETVSFGTHRHADRPASAIRSGASSMPSAWQSRSTPTHPSALHGEHTVRSFDEVIKEPFVWCVSTKIGKVVTALATGIALIVLFT